MGTFHLCTICTCTIFYGDSLTKGLMPQARSQEEIFTGALSFWPIEEGPGACSPKTFLNLISSQNRWKCTKVLQTSTYYIPAVKDNFST